MKAVQRLPDNYTVLEHIDLMKDRKAMMVVNGLGVAVFVLMAIWMHTVVPVTELMDEGLAAYLLHLAVLAVSYIAYIVLHELTHAAVMRAFGAKKLRFGFTGLYAYAGSEHDWFDKIAYRLIALAPLVVWGVIFGLLMAVVPKTWFWVVGLLQIGNVSGAMGDVYVTVRLWNRPADILVRDTGVEMTVYSASGAGKEGSSEHNHPQNPAAV